MPSWIALQGIRTSVRASHIDALLNRKARNLHFKKFTFFQKITCWRTSHLRHSVFKSISKDITMQRNHTVKKSHCKEMKLLRSYCNRITLKENQDARESHCKSIALQWNHTLRTLLKRISHYREHISWKSHCNAITLPSDHTTIQSCCSADHLAHWWHHKHVFEPRYLLQTRVQMCYNTLRVFEKSKAWPLTLDSSVSVGGLHRGWNMLNRWEGSDAVQMWVWCLSIS